MSTDGALRDCIKTIHEAALQTPLDIAVNGNKAYVTNLVAHTLATCNIEPNGQVSTCVAGEVGNTLRYPAGLAFLPSAR